jgi:hypothetical protein
MLLDIVITGATPHALLGEVASSRQRRNTVAA